MAQNELMNFDRLPHESIDALITRFMAIRSRAQTGGRMAMTWEGYSHLLLRACRVNPQQLVSLFSPFGGIPPTTEQQFSQMEMAIRRMGHILEGATFSLARQLQRPTQQTFLTQTGHAAKCTAARSIWRPGSMGIAIVKLIMGTSTTTSNNRSLGKLWSYFR